VALLPGGLPPTQFEHYSGNSAKESFADEQAKGSFAVSSG